MSCVSGKQEQLGGDELVAALLRFLVGEVEQVGELARDVDFAARALDLRQAVDRLLRAPRAAPATLTPARASSDAVPPSSWLSSA